MAKTESGVYHIINLNTGWFYVGSTIDLHKRKQEHFRRLRLNKHHNQYLQRSFNKHGEDKFVFIVSNYTNDYMNAEQIELDSYGIDELYNIASDALHPAGMTGKKHTEESRAKMSEAAKGHKINQRQKNALAEGRLLSDNRKKVLVTDPNGNQTVYSSLTEAAEFAGLHVSTISKYCLGKRKQPKSGYTFTFEEVSNG